MALAILTHARSTAKSSAVSTDIPLPVTQLAFYYAGQVVEANEVSCLSNILTQARMADVVARKDVGGDLLSEIPATIAMEFGAALIAQAIGASRGWFEKHAHFVLELPDLKLPPLPELLAMSVSAE
jgi:hypothetical protein